MGLKALFKDLVKATWVKWVIVSVCVNIQESGVKLAESDQHLILSQGATDKAVSKPTTTHD